MLGPVDPMGFLENNGAEAVIGLLSAFVTNGNGVDSTCEDVAVWDEPGRSSLEVADIAGA